MLRLPSDTGGKQNLTGAHKPGAGLLTGGLCKHFDDHIVQLPLKRKNLLGLASCIQPQQLKSGIVLLEVYDTPCQLIQGEIPAIGVCGPVQPDGWSGKKTAVR